MERRIFIALLVSLLILVLCNDFAVSANYYGLANDFLQYGAGARALGMGGAYVGMADDASAPYWNPAALTDIVEHQFLCMYAPFFEQTNYNFVSYIHPLGKFGSFGVSDVLVHQGGFDEVDEVGNIVGKQKYVLKNAVIVSYANKLDKRISLGASFKMVHQQVIRYSGNGQGMDLGILYRPLDGFNVGLTVQNVIQPKITLLENPDVYRTNLKGGLSISTLSDRLTMTADVNKLVGEDAYFSAGVEVSPWSKPAATLNRVDFRVGINHLQSFTCGVGARVKFLSLDYAFSSHDMGNLHRFALSFSWGNIYRAKVTPVLKAKPTYGLEGLKNELVFSCDIPSLTVKTWTLEVKNLKGEVKKTLSGSTRPPEIITWDVCDDSGSPLMSGTYTYEFTVVYKDGKNWIDKGDLILQSFPHEEGVVEMEIEANEMTNMGPGGEESLVK